MHPHAAAARATWTNNHPFYPGSARQGFRWYELDLACRMLPRMAALAWCAT